MFSRLRARRIRQRAARDIGGSQRGQALVELGLVIVMFVTLTMGIIEFGRAWMIANMVTHAARDGARSAAVVPRSNRDTSGIILSTSAIQTQVRNQIANVMGSAEASAFTVNVTQPTVSGIPMVTVDVIRGSVPYIFRLWGSGFAVNRSVSFRDEGR